MSEAIANARTDRARPAYKETLDLREVLHLFRDHFGKIFMCIALGVGIALFYLQHAKPVYTSSALLEVSQAGKQGVAPTEIETSEMLKTVELKLASQSVLLAVIKANNLAQDPEFASASPGILQSDSKPVQWLTQFLESIGASGAAAKLKGEPVAPGTVTSDAELVRRFAA